MMSDIRALQGQFDATRENMKEQQRLLDKKIKKVKKMLDKINEVARRTDANFGVQLEQMIKNLQQTTGKLELLQHRLEVMGKQVSQLKNLEKNFESQVTKISKESVTLDDAGKNQQREILSGVKRPEQPENFFELLNSYFVQKEYGITAILCNEFKAKWPSHHLEAQVLFLEGEMAFFRQAYQKAIISYQNIRETYPDNHFNDQILFKISQSFLKLGMKKEAKTFLTELIKKYKNSPLTKKAQKILKQLKGRKGNKKR